MNTEKNRRVVITGLGTVNPTGNTVAESWASIKAGRCAVGPITAFDTADFKVKLAAEVKDFDPERPCLNFHLKVVQKLYQLL